MNEFFFDTYKVVGAAIKKKRKGKGMTQQQLAEKAGRMDRSKISDIENGKEDFLFSTLLKLCLALETDIAEIVTEYRN